MKDLLGTPAKDILINMEAMDQKEIHKDKIISLAKEYVENVKCTCVPGPPENCNVCWKCLFEYNLNFLPTEKNNCTYCGVKLGMLHEDGCSALNKGSIDLGTGFWSCGNCHTEHGKQYDADKCCQ